MSADESCIKLSLDIDFIIGGVSDKLAKRVYN